MSYILDALKKSEQERELGKTPTLKSMPQALPERKRMLPLWFVASGIFLSSVAIAYFYFKPQQHTAQVTPPLTGVVATSDSIQKDASVSERTPITSESAHVSITGNNSLNITDEETAELNRRERLRKTQDSEDNRIADENGPNAVSLDKRLDTTDEEEDTEIHDTILPEIVLLEALPLEMRQKIPQLSLNVHVYDEDPSNRFILLNMRRYSEGQLTHEGLVLDEILPDGVVLSLSGSSFRLQTQ